MNNNNNNRKTRAQIASFCNIALPRVISPVALRGVLDRTSFFLFFFFFCSFALVAHTHALSPSSAIPFSSFVHVNLLPKGGPASCQPVHLSVLIPFPEATSPTPNPEPPIQPTGNITCCRWTSTVFVALRSKLNKHIAPWQ